MDNLEKVYDRVSKLLRLARSTNEAEAALAAQRAAELMTAHAISEAEVSLVDGTSRKAEPIVSDFAPEDAIIDAEDKGLKRKVAYRGTIAGGVAYAFGCRQYWRGAKIRLYGRESAVQSAAYTCQYLWREVERLADEAWAAKRREIALAAERSVSSAEARSWLHSFRLGAAVRIAERMRQAHDAERRQRLQTIVDTIKQRTPEPEPVEDAPAVEDATTQERAAPNAHALAIVNAIEQDEREVAEGYKAYSKRFRTVRGPRCSSGSGYSAGRRAGESVALGKRSAGLPAPPRQLPR